MTLFVWVLASNKPALSSNCFGIKVPLPRRQLHSIRKGKNSYLKNAVKINRNSHIVSGNEYPLIFYQSSQCLIKTEYPFPLTTQLASVGSSTHIEKFFRWETVECHRRWLDWWWFGGEIQRRNCILLQSILTLIQEHYRFKMLLTNSFIVNVDFIQQIESFCICDPRSAPIQRMKNKPVLIFFFFNIHDK